MKLKNIYVLVLCFLVFIGCRKAGGDYPGMEYMPDMKHSRAYEIYTPNNNFENGMTAQLPVVGSVARGYIPYAIANTNEGYEASATTVFSPFNNEQHQAAIKNGKALYTIYCAVCHGEGGKADGTIVKSGKYPPPPSYFRDDILKLSEGKMFHSITHGKNLMGGYASQVSQDERWQIISYIKDLQAKHIAGAQKISGEEALAQVFVGSNTAATVAQTDAHHSTDHHSASQHHDDEYADVLKYTEERWRRGHFPSENHGHEDDHGHHDDGHGKKEHKKDKHH